MTRTAPLAVIALAALAALSCDTTPRDIFPMTVGSVWNSDVLVTASSDTFVTGTYVMTAVQKANLTSGAEVVDMKTEITQHFLMVDTTVYALVHNYVREEGDWVISYSDLGDSIGDTMMTTTPAVGKTWHQGGATAEVLGQENVTVPAGTYKNAWKVKTSDTDGDLFYWYARGTGLVKVYSADTQNDIVSTLELTSAVIK